MARQRVMAAGDGRTAAAGTDAGARDRRPPSIRELKAICRKGELDPFWISNIFWRPVSIYITWLLIRLRVRPNQVTFVSGLFAVASSLVLLAPADATLLASVVLMQSFFLLDHVDGEIARFHARHGATAEDHSGRFFDALIHYFQTPSLYYCLGAGLALAEGDVRWAVVGVAAGIAGSGFPRLVAGWALVSVAGSRADAAFRAFLGQFGQFNAVYWKPEERPQRFFVLPRNRAELVFAAKQYISFPGNMFVFAAAALLDVFARGEDDFLFIELFLVFYAAVLLVNLAFVTRRYLRQLSAVPAPDEVGVQEGSGAPGRDHATIREGGER